MKSKQKFRYLFAPDGKMLQNLQEISREFNVVLVSHDKNFQGIKVEIEQDEQVDDKQIMNRINLKANLLFKKSQQIFGTSPRKMYDTLPTLGNQRITFAKRLRNSSQQTQRKEVSKDEKPQKRMEPLQQAYLVRYKIKENCNIIDRKFKQLTVDYLNQLRQRFKFTTHELHKLYAQYKTLLILNVARNPYHQIEQGIDKETFVQGVKRGAKSGDELLYRLFESIDINQNGFLDWEEYLTAMSVIMRGSLEEKIDLFFRVYDSSRNGNLSFADAKKISSLQLEQTVDSELLDELSSSFASYIFDLAEVPYDKKLASSQLKQVLGQKQEEKELIEMFCSFSFLSTMLSLEDLANLP